MECSYKLVNTMQRCTIKDVLVQYRKSKKVLVQCRKSKKNSSKILYDIYRTSNIPTTTVSSPTRE